MFLELQTKPLVREGRKEAILESGYERVQKVLWTQGAKGSVLHSEMPTPNAM